MHSESRKITTLNVWHFDVARESRSTRMGKEIQQLKPDIVLLQEVPFETEEGHSSFLNRLASEAGMAIVDATVFARVENNGDPYWDGLAILSNLPVIETGKAYVADQGGPSANDQAHYAVFDDDGKALITFNVHGVWGGHLAHRRENQFKALNTHASILEAQYREKEAIVVLGGDFNTEPDSSVVRYLKGLQGLGEDGTYWVDAWDLCGEGNGETSTSKAKFFTDTALNRGNQHPHFTPDRRIDYIFVKGWVYGQRGMPLDVGLCFNTEDGNGYTPSDHYGLTSSIWCP